MAVYYFSVWCFYHYNQMNTHKDKGERSSVCISCGKTYFFPKNVLGGLTCDECHKSSAPMTTSSKTNKVEFEHIWSVFLDILRINKDEPERIKTLIWTIVHEAKEAGREEILSLADGITYHVEDGKMADVRKDLLDYEKFLQELKSK